MCQTSSLLEVFMYCIFLDLLYMPCCHRPLSLICCSTSVCNRHLDFKRATVSALSCLNVLNLMALLLPWHYGIVNYADLAHSWIASDAAFCPGIVCVLFNVCCGFEHLTHLTYGFLHFECIYFTFRICIFIPSFTNNVNLYSRAWVFLDWGCDWMCIDCFCL